MPTLCDFGECVVLPSAVSASMNMLEPKLSLHVLSNLQTVEFKIAVEHDCQYIQCEATGTRHQMQEQQETERVIKVMKHLDDEHFIINLLSLHNPHLVREVLPAELTAPKRAFPDRQGRLREVVDRMGSG